MKKPILVTGSHRSGSTWIGKIISQAPDVGYIHEPFNIGITRFNPPFTHWYKHLSDDTDTGEQNSVKKYMRSFYGFPSGLAFARIFRTRSFKDAYFTLWDIGDLNRRMAQRTLFKDPIALMSAEWLYKTIDCDVVIAIRHPAAFIASLRVKGWDFDFNNLLNQKELMDSLLSEYKDEIEEHAKNPKEIIEQGILLWNVLYHVVSVYKKKYAKEWVFVRHEDVSLNPMGEYERIFSQLDIEFTDKVIAEIKESTTSSVKSNHKRDAAKNVKTWKDRLTVEEIAIIKEGTKAVSAEFYSEEDWE
jgi:Sulfotransferase domain